MVEIQQQLVRVPQILRLVDTPAETRYNRAGPAAQPSEAISLFGLDAAEPAKIAPDARILVEVAGLTAPTSAIECHHLVATGKTTMRIKLADRDNHETLLALMQECHDYAGEDESVDWDSASSALATLLGDVLAGEAYLIFDGQDLAGYMIICRGFSLENGGYFSWIEETYLREPAEAH
jgi:hypothetical protein